MKKKSILFTACLLLVAAMMALLCACSAYGGIKSAYEKEGYKEFEYSEALKKALGNEAPEDEAEAKYTVHLLTKAEITDDDLNNTVALGVKLAASLLKNEVALIWEYKDTASLQEAYKKKLSEEEKEKFDELWAEYQKSPVVNGNCILLLGDQKIFASAK